MSGFMIEENKYREVTFQDVLEMIKEVEETFTTYLVVKQCQWSNQKVREMFMEQFMVNTDLQVLKENIKSLQESFLFA